MAHTSSTGVGKNLIYKINNFKRNMIEKHVPACTDEVLAKFGYQKSAKQWAKTCAQSYTFFIERWRARSSAATAPRCCSALCVKMEKKANRKKNRRRSDKTRAILFYNGKPGRNMQVAIGVFVLGANAIATAVIFLRDLTISKTPAPPTHTHPLPRERLCVPFHLCVFFSSFA